jgi:hypothetical protein
MGYIKTGAVFALENNLESERIVKPPHIGMTIILAILLFPSEPILTSMFAPIWAKKLDPVIFLPSYSLSQMLAMLLGVMGALVVDLMEIHY